jgi:4-hydroxy-tetrahydrodipicolinate synthase
MRGVFTALITPFQNDGALDLEAFKKLLADQRAAGVSGVIPCGTTGESPTLSSDEKKTLIQTAIDSLKGSGVKVIAGSGSNNTRETIELSKWASEKGADGVLIVTPYYNKPSQAAMSAHYQAVAEAVKCEVIPYNVPGRTGVSMTAQTMAALAAHPRITSLKEATGNVALTSEVLDLLAASDKNLDILSGDDATYLPLLSVGAVGVISVASNLFPRAMVALQKAFEHGEVAEAQKLHARFFPLFKDLFIDSNPVPIKYAMAKIGFCKNVLRAPLLALSNADSMKLDLSLERCGFSSQRGTL